MEQGRGFWMQQENGRYANFRSVFLCSKLIRFLQTSHFVGLDIVPLQPDLRALSFPALAERISFIQANL